MQPKTYKELKGYESLKLDEINDKTTADEWLEKAKEADKLSEKKIRLPNLL